MKKTKGREVKRTVVRVSKKTKDGINRTTVTTRRVKVKAGNLLNNARKKLNKFTKKSTKRLSRAKDKVYATEKEILAYVKAHPVKSGSAVALVGLIAGFIAYKKGR